MTLYRYNLKLSQEMFALISCFEVTLRNRIDKEMKVHFGNDWLRDLVLPGGAFYANPRVDKTYKIIKKAYDGLNSAGTYSHSKLLSEMEFGVWKYMFNNLQYGLCGRHLLRIFPNKPRSTRTNRIDNSRIFLELDYINNIRNRIAHHEPICFDTLGNRSLAYAQANYKQIIKYLAFLGYTEKEILYGYDVQTQELMNKIMSL